MNLTQNLYLKLEETVQKNGARAFWFFQSKLNCSEESVYGKQRHITFNNFSCTFQITLLSLVPTYEINLFSEEQIFLVYEINVRDYFIRLSVLIACVPTKLYYKCQMFLWWRLFSSFADSFKVLGCGIHFKLCKDDGAGARFLYSN